MSSTEEAALEASIVALGFDILSAKRYWIAITTLWAYEYFLTIGDEIRYVWKGNKNLVFWLFFLNRYLCFIIIAITCTAYFTPLFTDSICLRYGYVEQLETMIMATIAEVLVLIRVYALSGRKRYVLFIGIPIILVQWALLLYQDLHEGYDELALLLSRRDSLAAPALPALPTLPDIDAFRLCISIPTAMVAKAGETFLSLLIVYDGLAVMAIVYHVVRQAKGMNVVPILQLIQRDGLLYFSVMFSSNLVWLMMALYARPGLRFIQNQPAMVISSILVNRITINLKKASEERMVISWTGARRASRSVHEHAVASISTQQDIELGPYDHKSFQERRFTLQ